MKIDGEMSRFAADPGSRELSQHTRSLYSAKELLRCACSSVPRWRPRAPDQGDRLRGWTGDACSTPMGAWCTRGPAWPSAAADAGFQLHAA